MCLLRRRMDEFGLFFLFFSFFWIRPRRSLYQQGINSEHLVGYQVILLYSSGVRAIVEHFKLRKWIRVVLNLACPIGGARRPPNKVPRSSSKNLGKKCHLVSRTTTKTSLYVYAGRRLIKLRPHSAHILFAPVAVVNWASGPSLPCGLISSLVWPIPSRGY